MEEPFGLGTASIGFQLELERSKSSSQMSQKNSSEYNMWQKYGDSLEHSYADLTLYAGILVNIWIKCCHCVVSFQWLQQANREPTREKFIFLALKLWIRKNENYWRQDFQLQGYVLHVDRFGSVIVFHHNLLFPSTYLSVRIKWSSFNCKPTKAWLGSSKLIKWNNEPLILYQSPVNSELQNPIMYQISKFYFCC